MDTLRVTDIDLITATGMVGVGQTVTDSFDLIGWIEKNY